jgi:hypothetical protein
LRWTCRGPQPSNPEDPQGRTISPFFHSVIFLNNDALLKRGDRCSQTHPFLLHQEQEVAYLRRSLVGRIEYSVSWVLNPLSHSQTVERYRKEIEEAIFSVDELRRAVEMAISGEFQQLTRERELLLRVIPLVGEQKNFGFESQEDLTERLQRGGGNVNLH